MSEPFVPTPEQYYPWNPPAPLGTYANPIVLDGPIPGIYPEEYADRPAIYGVPKGGSVTKWYRSYSDYCD